MKKLSAEEVKSATEVLTSLDRLASEVQANAKTWGMPFKFAKLLVNKLDKIADAVELQSFGPESMARRQVAILKEAKVIQRDADEGYMDAFNKVHGIVQRDSDEAYMEAFNDDQSSAVRSGVSSSGRKLAP
jgi:hypothetical protein